VADVDARGKVARAAGDERIGNATAAADEEWQQQ
jgi:hypothetical protein